jgi:hypothetical protein
VGDAPLSVTSADFNGDAQRDLAVANISSDNVSVLLGNGDGTLGLPQNFGAGDGPRDILSVDVNNDGFLDLAVTNNVAIITSEYAVTVLLGNGDGTFGAPKSFAVGLGPEHLTSADFDGDGNADLATTNSGSATPDPGGGASYKVSVHLGNGDGTFQSAQNIPTGNCPWGITSADFNNDGHDDLATSNSCGGSEGVRVHLGNGSSLKETVTYLLGETGLNNQSLQTKLDDALAHLRAGRTASACNKVDDFIRTVSAQSGKKIDSGYADILTTDANRIKAVIGCK